MNDYTTKAGDDLPLGIGAIVNKEGRISLEGPIKAARQSIRAKYPVEKNLADLLKASSSPRLRDIKDILAAVQGDTLRLDQIFDMTTELQAWEIEKATNQAKRDEALAALDNDIKAIVTETESKLQDSVEQALEKMR